MRNRIDKAAQMASQKAEQYAPGSMKRLEEAKQKLAGLYSSKGDEEAVHEQDGVRKIEACTCPPILRGNRN